MPTSYQKDYQSVFVGKTPVAITTGNPTTLNDGEIGLFTKGGTRLTESSAATTTEFVIHQGRGSSNPPLVSDIITVANIKRINKKTYSASTEQVDYIGYNGTSGALEAIDSNLYYVRLNINQSLTSNHGGLYVKRGEYYSPNSGTTQATVAYGITNSLINEFKKEPERQMKAERVHSDAGTAVTVVAGTDATHLTFVKGSKYVTGTISGTPATGTDEVISAIAAGDYLRAGTATTDPVYKVVTNTSGTASTPLILELDLPYQGDTTNIAYGSTEVITAALAAAGNFGIKLSGLALTFNLPKIHYRKMRWYTSVENFGTATVTNSTAATEGSGTYEQMAELEWFSQGNEGEFYRTPNPIVFTPRQDVSNQGYDQITIDVVAPNSTGDNSLIPTNAVKTYSLVIPNTTPAFADGGSADDITDVLEVLFYGSATGALAL